MNKRTKLLNWYECNTTIRDIIGFCLWLVGLEIVQLWSISHVMLTEIDVLVRMKQLFKSVQ